MAIFSEQPQMGCCPFLHWPSLASRHGYRSLTVDGYNSDSPSDNKSTVTVIAGKERRLFFVDPLVLQRNPFIILMKMARIEKDAIFVDVDGILFEHMLWLVSNDGLQAGDSLFELTLKEIIEFYSQE